MFASQRTPRLSVSRRRHLPVVLKVEGELVERLLVRGSPSENVICLTAPRVAKPCG